jgi:CubicO group peptidase (beta-lactamase class C family)
MKPPPSRRSPQSGWANISRRELLASATVGGLVAAFASPVIGASPAPQTAGAAWDRKEALDAVINDAVSGGQIVGATVIVAKNGEIVYQRATGFADREAQLPIKEDEVYRLASMTKPIVCVTALALVDRGQLRLDDLVTRWLSSFRPKLVNGREPVITIRHLLTHTAGLTYGFLEPQDGGYHRSGVSDGLDVSGLTLEDNLLRIASAPLAFRTGDKLALFARNRRARCHH